MTVGLFRRYVTAFAFALPVSVPVPVFLSVSVSLSSSVSVYLLPSLSPSLSLSLSPSLSPLYPSSLSLTIRRMLWETSSAVLTTPPQISSNASCSLDEMFGAAAPDQPLIFQVSELQPHHSDRANHSHSDCVEPDPTADPA